MIISIEFTNLLNHVLHNIFHNGRPSRHLIGLLCDSLFTWDLVNLFPVPLKVKIQIEIRNTTKS